MPKRATARDVAEKAGVSRTTVSFVLNDVAGIRISDDTRRAVLQAAADLGYHPDATARRMVSGRTRVLGFVLHQRPDQAYTDHFVPTVLNGFAQAASEQGYKVLFETIPPGEGAANFTGLLQERHVDGIALSGPRSDDDDLLRLHAAGAPIVLLGQLPGSQLAFVDVDNRGGAALATQHLLDLGHRRIGLITNADPVYTASADRLAGYRHALEAAGLPFNPAWVRYGNFTPQSGGEAMTALLDAAADLTAIFVASDTVALGALAALRRAGRVVPDDMALVGFDDVPMAEYLDPPLTTVRLPAYGLGWGAGELLTRRLAGEEIRHPQLLLETELIVRESSGAERPLPVRAVEGR
jgi:LacI family transcriptional regulator